MFSPGHGSMGRSHIRRAATRSAAYYVTVCVNATVEIHRVIVSGAAYVRTTAYGATSAGTMRPFVKKYLDHLFSLCVPPTYLWAVHTYATLSCAGKYASCVLTSAAQRRAAQRMCVNGPLLTVVWYVR